MHEWLLIYNYIIYNILYFIYAQTPYDTVSNIEFFNPLHNFNTAVECSAHNSETIDAAIRIDVMPWTTSNRNG